MSEVASWLDIPADTHFSLYNIPFGIITSAKDRDKKRVATAIGVHVLDLAALAGSKGQPAFLSNLAHVFDAPALNSFAALGPEVTAKTRQYVQSLFLVNSPNACLLRDNASLRSQVLLPQHDVTLHLPFQIGDYTDFYVGLHHAMNCGKIMRGPGQELQPNYKHLPVGYHGRASSVVVSGTPITRPHGQILLDSNHPQPKPVLSPTRRLDFELELGCFVAMPNAMGRPIRVADARKHLFGLVLMNDWSARDIQKWEMAPLGPFLSKSFATSISPWVVTMAALEPFMVPCLESDRALLPYLCHEPASMLPEIELCVGIKRMSYTNNNNHNPPRCLSFANESSQIASNQGNEATIVTRTTSKNLLFSFDQMLAHHTVNGCPFNTGDLMGSGTISGPEPGAFGSLLEQSLGGTVKVKVGSQERVFLEDGDEVVLEGVCGHQDYKRVGFGPCTGLVKPAYSIAEG